MFFEDKGTSTPSLLDELREIKVATSTPSTTTSTPIVAKDLTKDHKEKIEEWLKEQNLNRYGDVIGTYYEQGSPLIDKVTGEAVERFEYILSQHPEVIKLLTVDK